MILKNKVSDSAYMVNVSRTKSVEISKDIYSHLWIPYDQKQEVTELWNSYSKKVYPYDHIELGIRTHYFLKFLRSHLKKNKDLIFVNIGSGFTSYQYLVNYNVTTIEVDYRDVINVKKRRAKKLLNSGVIPKRETHYVSCNLSNKRSRVNAFNKIERLVDGKKTLVLCEGLFYYLGMKTIESLIHNLSVLQSENDVFGFDFWLPSIKNSSLYNGMIEFYSDEMDIAESQITLFDLTDISALNSYKLVEQTDVFEQEYKLTKSKELKENRGICLEENYARFKLKKPAHNNVYK